MQRSHSLTQEVAFSFFFFLHDVEDRDAGLARLGVAAEGEEGAVEGGAVRADVREERDVAQRRQTREQRVHGRDRRCLLYTSPSPRD